MPACRVPCQYPCSRERCCSTILQVLTFLRCVLYYRQYRRTFRLPVPKGPLNHTMPEEQMRKKVSCSDNKTRRREQPHVAAPHDIYCHSHTASPRGTPDQTVSHATFHRWCRFLFKFLYCMRIARGRRILSPIPVVYVLTGMLSLKFIVTGWTGAVGSNLSNTQSINSTRRT